MGRMGSVKSDPGMGCRISPVHPNTSGDHMTILFSPGWDKLPEMLALPIGVGIQLEITGIITDSAVQVCSCPLRACHL